MVLAEVGEAEVEAVGEEEEGKLRRTRCLNLRLTLFSSLLCLKDFIEFEIKTKSANSTSTY